MKTIATKYSYVTQATSKQLPLCNISSISLSNGSHGSVKKRRDAEYITQDQVKRSISRSNDFVSNEQDMQVVLRLNLFLGGTQMSDLFFNKTPEHLKVRVMQCSAENIYETISKDPSLFITPGARLPETIRQYVQFKEFKLADIIPFASNSQTGVGIDGSLSSNFDDQKRRILAKFDKYSLTDGTEVYQVPLSFTFNIDEDMGGSKIEHLSYFAVSCYDIEEMFENRNTPAYFLEKIEIKKMAIGNATSELVISGGSVVKDTHAYHDSAGNYWLGQIHFHDEQNPDPTGYVGYMGGLRKHMASGANPPKLIQKTYKNCKVIDNRVLYNLKNKIIDIEDKTGDQISDQRILSQKRIEKSSRQFKRRNQAFSDLYYTSDKSKNVRFIFHMDHHRVLKQAMAYPGLLDIIKSREPDLYNSMIGTERVATVRLFRKQLKNINRLGSGRKQFLSGEDVTSQEELIYSSAGSELYESKPFSALRATETRKGSPTELSQLVEVQAKTGASTNIKTLTGTDLKTRALKGIYEYRIELELVDPTISMLERIDRRLDIILDGSNRNMKEDYRPGLNAYYMDSLSKKTYYDKNLDRFKPVFYDHYLKNYQNTSPEGTTSSFIFSMIKQFVDSVSILNSLMSSSDLADLYEHLVTISSPVTGSPQGISETIKVVRQLKREVQKLISSAGAISKTRAVASENKQLADSANVLGSSDSKRRVVVSHVFDNKLNTSEVLSEKFYDFLSIKQTDAERNNDGLLVVPSSYIEERTMLESNKYFTNMRDNIDISDENGRKLTKGDTVSKKRYTFLSPARVYLDTDGRSLELLNSGELNQDRKKQNDTLNEIINFNFGKVNNNGGIFSNHECGEESEEILEQFIGINGITIKNRDLDGGNREGNEDRVELFQTSNSTYKAIFNADLVDFESEEENPQRNEARRRKTADISKISNFNMFKPYNNDKFYNINGAEDCANIRKSIPKLGSAGYDAGRSDITNQPNHLKALMLGAANSKKVNPNSVMRTDYDAGDGTPSRSNQEQIPTNSLRDIENQGYVYFNYKNIQRIQVLRTFGTDGNSFSVGNQVWEDLRGIDLNQDNNSLLICRMVTYEQPEYGYERDSSLSLPICNDLFFIDVSKNASVTGARSRVTLTESKYRGRTNNLGRSSFKRILSSKISEINRSRSMYLEINLKRGYKNSRPLPEFTQTNNFIRTEQDTSLGIIDRKGLNQRVQALFGSLTNAEIFDKLINMGFGSSINRQSSSDQRQTTRTYIQNIDTEGQLQKRIPFPDSRTTQGTRTTQRSGASTGRASTGAGSTTGGGGGGGSTY